MLSSALMLRHMGRRDAADLVERAVFACVSNPETRTRDLGGSQDTEGFTSAVLRRMDTLMAASEVA